MRKLIVSESVTLDGVMQAPGARTRISILPEGVHTTLALKSAKPYPTGVVGLHYVKR